MSAFLYTTLVLVALTAGFGDAARLGPSVHRRHSDESVRHLRGRPHLPELPQLPNSNAAGRKLKQTSTWYPGPNELVAIYSGYVTDNKCVGSSDASFGFPIISAVTPCGLAGSSWYVKSEGEAVDKEYSIRSSSNKNLCWTADTVTPGPVPLSLQPCAKLPGQIFRLAGPLQAEAPINVQRQDNLRHCLAINVADFTNTLTTMTCDAAATNQYFKVLPAPRAVAAAPSPDFGFFQPPFSFFDAPPPVFDFFTPSPPPFFFDFTPSLPPAFFDPFAPSPPPAFFDPFAPSPPPASFDPFAPSPPPGFFTDPFTSPSPASSDPFLFPNSPPDTAFFGVSPPPPTGFLPQPPIPT